MDFPFSYTTFDHSRMLNAFVLFREKGMEAVEQTFPEYKNFVEENKEKSVRQVKQQLFAMQKVAS